MAASDHLHPGQLQMFMRPQEILDSTTGSIESGPHVLANGQPGRTKQHMAMKLQEASEGEDPYVYSEEKGKWEGQGPSLVDDVKAHGVEKPIILSDTGPNGMRHGSWIGNGHHRLAAAMQAEKDTGRQQYIPVIHDRHYMGTQDTINTFGVPDF